MVKENLSQNILTYIGYCLAKDGHKLSYQRLSDCLERANGRPYSIRTLRKEVSLLKKAGLITSKLRYRKPVPVLTLSGKLAISTLLSYKKFGPWDGRWRLVICNILDSEKKFRQKFQSELIRMGFEKLARNVYLSPHQFLSSAKRLAYKYAVDMNCIFIEAEKIENQSRAIEKIWRTEEINKDYQGFTEDAKSALGKKKDLEWPFYAKKLELQFARIYGLDPHLPESILPKDWCADEAYKIFKEIVKSY